MVFIFISWLYIFLTSVAFGIGFSKLLRIPFSNVVITSILGLFSITILASIWVIFGPINFVFHLILLLISLLLGILNKEQLITVFQKTKSLYLAFPLAIKVLLLISSLLILAQSATLPFIIDNETYYIQTIKWLNEYGFVPGLANLHLFFGQTSGWHIAQSVFSFSFLYDRFNDLNGYCLLIVNFWAFQLLHSYFTSKNKMNLAFGLLPLSYIFLFQFVSAPSPDFPVCLFSFILFWLYLENENFALIVAIVLFIVYIKITAVVLLLLPLFLLFNKYYLFKKELIRVGFLSTLIFILFVVKNTILTGYPLFPITFISLSSINFAVPIEIMDFFFSKSMMHSFYIPFGAFENASLIEILIYYFFRNGLDSIIAMVTVVLVLVSPIVIAKQYSKTKVWDVYVVFILLIALLVLSSPQYRFYVYFTIFFGLLLVSLVLTNRKVIVASLSFSLLGVAVLVLVPISFSAFTNNKSLASNSTFHLKNILVPDANTKGRQQHVLLSTENLTYYSPIDYPFFWITGNGELPCVNAEQLEYFEANFHYIPQLRSGDLKDGFYSKKTSAND